MTRSLLLAAAAVRALTAAAQPAPTPPASEPPTWEDYVSVDRPFATIYAPTEADLMGALEEVSYAALQFDRAFGEAAPKITVVLAESPAALDQLDLHALRAEGRPLLPFITPQGLDGAANATIVGGAVLLSEEEGVRVMAVLPDATLLVSPGDQITAVGGRPVRTPDAARAALGAPGTDVRIDGLRDGEPFTTRFRVPDDVSTPRAAVASGAAPARPLSHEAGHLFLKAYVAAHAPDAEPDGYGSPLPDWFDEAFATWCEVPALIRRRDALLARHPLPALDSLWTMRHPLVAAGIGLGLPPSLDGAPRVRRVALSGDQKGALEQAALFYSHVSSFVRFLAATRGDRAFGHLVDAALADDALRTPPLPNDRTTDALRAEWQAWLDQTISIAGKKVK